MEMEIKFEAECYRCYGGSRWSGKDCEPCGNTGRVSTALGDELIEFLENQKRRDQATIGRREIKNDA
jgi:hypothetical protein